MRHVENSKRNSIEKPGIIIHIESILRTYKYQSWNNFFSDENESANRRKGTLRRQQDVSKVKLYSLYLIISNKSGDSDTFKESGLQTESLEEDKYGYAMPIECQIGGETSE